MQVVNSDSNYDPVNPPLANKFEPVGPHKMKSREKKKPFRHPSLRYLLCLWNDQNSVLSFTEVVFLTGQENPTFGLLKFVVWLPV